MFRTVNIDPIRVNGQVEDPAGRARIVDEIMTKIPLKPTISTTGQPPPKAQRTEYTHSAQAHSIITDDNDKEGDASVDEGVEEFDGLQPDDIFISGIAQIQPLNGRAIRKRDPITGTGTIVLSAQVHNPEHFNWLIDKVEKYEITLRPISEEWTDTTTAELLPTLDDGTVIIKPRIVSIEGNIGAGKTALIRAIEQECESKGITNIITIPDPTTHLDRFEENDRKLIDLYYAQPQRYGFLFQTIVHTILASTLRSNIANAQEGTILICERSISSAQHVYTDFLHETNCITDLQKKILCKLFCEEGVGDISTTDLLYLKALPNFCVGKVNRYDDDGNEIITLNFLRHQERLLTEYCQYWTGESCLTIHGKGTNEQPIEQELRMERIMKFLLTKKRKVPDHIKRYTSIPEIISIEGNIGSGKTKILRQLFKTVSTGPRRRDVFVIYDTTETDDLASPSEGRLSELFYGNKTRYAFMYIVAQITTFRSRIKEVIRDCIDVKYIICEKSIHSLHILAQMLHHQGHLTTLEAQVIDELCKDTTLDYLNPKRSFYLDTSITTCLDRIIRRVEADRRAATRQIQGEKNIDHAYLAEYKRFLDDSLLVRSATIIDGDLSDRRDRDILVTDILDQLQELPMTQWGSHL